MVKDERLKSDLLQTLDPIVRSELHKSQYSTKETLTFQSLWILGD